MIRAAALCLRNNELTDSGIASLFEGLANHDQLFVIDVRNNTLARTWAAGGLVPRFLIAAHDHAVVACPRQRPRPSLNSKTRVQSVYCHPARPTRTCGLCWSGGGGHTWSRSPCCDAVQVAAGVRLAARHVPLQALPTCRTMLTAASGPTPVPST